MAKKHHEEHDGEHENSERWLLTYSDMITLLMVLFIVLFAMGTTDTRKFNAFKDSFKTSSIGPAPILKGGVGVLNADNTVTLIQPVTRVTTVDGKESTSPTSIQSPAASNLPNSAASAALLAAAQEQAAAQQAEMQTLAAAEAKIKAALAAAGLANQATFTVDLHGLKVTIATDHVLFNVGSAQLLPEGVAVINAITPTLMSLPNQIAIDGHTDNQPITGTYPSNWELSTARATAVLRYMISAFSFPPERLSASGFADTRPLQPNNSPANQASNRRVEVIVEPIQSTS